MNEIMNDIGLLQEAYKALFNEGGITKKALCETVIPFRDKYNLTDLQALQIARNELSISEINNLIKLSETDKLTGTLRTRENNAMSLSCSGEMELKDNIIMSVYYKGMPRANGVDAWFGFYSRAKVGDLISPLKIQKILDYNGKYNIISTLN